MPEERITLTNAAVIINGDKIKIVPNSLSYDAGEGEINVRAAVLGDEITSVHSYNAETAISMVEFSVFTTPDIDQLVATWKANIAGNTIGFTQKLKDGRSAARTFAYCSLTGAVKRETGADAVTALEWKGDQMFVS